MLDKFWGRGDDLEESVAALAYTFNSFAFLGTYPPENHGNGYYFYAAVMNAFNVIITPLVFGVALIPSDKVSISQLVLTLETSLNVFAMPVKVLTLLLSMHRLKRSKLYMKILDERCTLSSERAQIRYTTIVGNRIFILFASVFYIYVSSTVIVKIPFRQPPFSMYVPFWDWRNSTLEYCYQLAFEISVLFIAIYSQIANDSYGSIYILVIRTHIQILSARIRRLGTNKQNNADEHLEELVKCIVDHKNILSLMDTISPVISNTIFAQFVVLSLTLGVTLFNVLIFADTTGILISVFYILAVLMETFPCCYQSTLLETDREDLPLAIFQCNWVDQDIRFRKMCVFFIQCTQKPMTLMAMNFFPIDLRTNISIAKFSFSLYTMIENMGIGKNWND